MSFHTPTKLELAVHEAGHAYTYAALIRYEEPEEMGLAVDARGNSHGWSRRRTILLREISFARAPADVRPAIEWQADVEIVIAIAGPLAEFRHRHRGRFAATHLAMNNVEKFLEPNAFDTDGDFQQIRNALEHVGERAPADRLKSLIFVADEVLATNWPNVRRLSRRLFDLGKLDANFLEDWFEQHPARLHNHPMRAS